MQISSKIGLLDSLEASINPAKEDGNLATIAGAVSGSEMQVDVLTIPTVAVTGTFWQATQPVSIAGTVTVDLGANNDVTVTSGAITETNSGTIAAAVATEGSALGSGVLLQGDDGTDRKNVAVDSTTGNLEIKVNSAEIQLPTEKQAIYRPLHASTTTALDASASYTSDGEDATSYDRITGTVFADQAGTLYIEQSPDGTNWDDSTSVSVSASAGQSFSVELVSYYVRIRYVNGGTAQGTFRLSAYLKV